MDCYTCGKDSLISTGEYVVCPFCRTLRTIHPYQEGVYGREYADTSLQNTMNEVNMPLMINRLSLISKWIAERKSILDIGCGVGEFIRFAEQYYICYGVEPNEFAQEVAGDRYHSPVYKTLNGEIPPVDAVTLFDVLEHLDDPRRMMQTIGSHYLNDGGYLIITTPCLDAVLQSGRVEFWKHFKPKEHLFLFSQESLFKLFSQAGFDIVHVDYEESNIRPNNPNRDIITVVGRKL